MKYPVTRNESYDFLGQSYADCYPNLHRYPATMLPQIGINILKELGFSKGSMLDPYCGSGSSFAAGLECGFTDMYGFDLNPLAIRITKAKFTPLDLKQLEQLTEQLRQNIQEALQIGLKLPKPDFPNIDYWFSPQVLNNLAIINACLANIADEHLRNFCQVPFSETLRAVSYTRNNEFKLYRMKPADILAFNPNVVGLFFSKLNQTIKLYEQYYLPKLKNIQVQGNFESFSPPHHHYDVVLTSPPYGDSKTTVAYGQFSLFANEWLGFSQARQLDNRLMGGRKSGTLYTEGIIGETIRHIQRVDERRALEVSAFYADLATSIHQIAPYIRPGGYAIYVVGNRRVKNVQLPTDQFIAEQFEGVGFQHRLTYERLLSNKTMPSQNSPTNQKGKKVNTMLYEYIIVCQSTENTGKTVSA